MQTVDLILKKRNGEVLTEEEIQYFVDGVKDKSIPDYQISALLMAIYFQGMNEEETAQLTRAMAQSGDQLSFAHVEGKIVDKHSSGGVGDKTTLIIAPIVAACGLPVAKLSGRGLGFTGGTVDKLESIPGFCTEVSEEDFLRFVEKDGIAVVGQSAEIAPVDKVLYALRDVTGTVDSLPLISASIMSKKLADGSDAIVLDVKYGSGAFMKTPEEAVALAEAMVSIGERNGKRTWALVTDMDQPLGHYVGNNLEVKEALEVLRGEGPKDLVEESVILASAMLLAGEKAKNLSDARCMVQSVIQDGSALRKLYAMVKNQGGDVQVLEDPSRFPVAPICMEVRAECDGVVQSINAEEVGKASLLLGAGRATKEDTIDPSVGLCVLRKVGDAVKKGEVLFRIFANSEDKAEAAKKKVLQAYVLGEEKVHKHSPIFAMTQCVDGVVKTQRWEDVYENADARKQ